MVAAAVAGALGLRDGAPGEATPSAFRRLFAAVASERPLVLGVRGPALGGPRAARPRRRSSPRGLRAPVLLLVSGPARSCSTPAPAGAAVRPAALERRGEPPAARRARRCPAHRQAAVAARAGGNPLFLEQLAAHVAERGAPGALPPALHALLAARLDLLDPADRALLEAAAIEGARFHLGGVQAVAADAAAGAAARRARRPGAPAAGGSWSSPGERAWRFRHALVHDAAYAVAAARRTRRRSRADRGLARAPVAPEARRPHRRCTSSARTPPRRRCGASARPRSRGRAAARLAAAAARDAHRRGDLPGEIGLPEPRRRRCSRGDDGARAELLPALAGALFEAGTLARGEAVAEEALALAGRLGLPGVRARAAVERERLRVFLHPETRRPAGVARACVRRDRAARAAGRRARPRPRALPHLRARLAAGPLRVGLPQRGAGRAPRPPRRQRVRDRHRRELHGVGDRRQRDPGRRRGSAAATGSSGWSPVASRRSSVRGFRAVLGAMAGRTAEARREIAAARAGLAGSRAARRRRSGWRSTSARRVAGGRPGRRRASARGRRAARRRDRRPLVPLDASSSTARTRCSRRATRRARPRPSRGSRPSRRRTTASGGSSAPPRAAGSPRSRATSRSPSPRRRPRPPSPTAPRCSPSAPTRTATSRVSRRGSSGVRTRERGRGAGARALRREGERGGRRTGDAGGAEPARRCMIPGCRAPR